jgi:hypothetical protein
MTTRTSTSFRLSALALTLAAAGLLSACGGGDSGVDTAGAREFVSQIATKHPLAAAGRESALSLTVAQVDAKALFDWAEFKFPELFPKGAQNLPTPIPYEGSVYTVRAYPNGNFLGLRNDGAVFGLGPFTGNVLTPFGFLSDYAASVVAEQCQVNPASCVPTTEPSGPLNECMLPAATALTTGNRIVLSYLSYETNRAQPTAEYTIDGIVTGAATFEGQSAVLTTSNISGTVFEGMTTSVYSGVNKDYSQVAQNGFTRQLGGESDTQFGTGADMFRSQSKYVVTAGQLNSEFALQPGQSFNKRETLVSTQLAPFPLPPTTSDFVETITFEARESVSVQAGTFDTCRYRYAQSDGISTLVWYIVGRGIPAKSQTTSSGRTDTQELKSGTYNGAPL